jgi:transcriptional regulator
MYLPRRFAETDLAELDRLVARDAFATLVTVDAEGLPFASHLPVLYARDGGTVRFSGHWARPNPQARHDGPALLVVHGPHAYISPSWYADQDGQVPTWNYAVAHIGGRLERSEDPALLQALVAELAAKYEGPLGSGWQPAYGSAALAQDLRGIVGFTLQAERIELKFKLNQNHPAANVEGAAAALERSGEPLAAETAALMRERLARRASTETSP